VRAVAKEATGISLTFGMTVQGTVNRSYKQSTLGAGAVTVTNTGDSTVGLLATAPTVPDPPPGAASRSSGSTTRSMASR
jgi:hypothetical protein